MAALDILRVLRTDEEAMTAFLSECAEAAEGNPLLDRTLAAAPEDVARAARSEEPEWDARRFAETLALAFQASLLVRFAPHAVADAFCESRLGDRGLTYGGLPRGADVDAILARVLP